MRGKKRPFWERMNDTKYNGIWDVIVLPAVLGLAAWNVWTFVKDRRASRSSGEWSQRNRA